MSSTTAAVIIVSYNAPDHLANCLNSLKRENLSRLKVVVIDNASSHPEVKKQLIRAGKWARVVFNSRNIGFGPANNQAAAGLKTDWLIFINNDTYWPPGNLSQFINQLSLLPDKVVAVGPKLLNLDNSLQFSFGAKPNWFNLTAWALGLDNIIPLPALHIKNPKAYQSRRQVGWLSGAFLAIRRQVFEKAGGWPADIFMYGEDVVLSEALSHYGQLLYLPDVSFYHAGHASGSKESARLREAWFWYDYFTGGLFSLIKKLYLYWIILAGFGLRAISFGLLGRWDKLNLNLKLFLHWLLRQRQISASPRPRSACS